MILFAAIDILEGKAVRLAQGAFDARTEYDADPLVAAKRWVGAGARALHVVDLDGRGDPAHVLEVGGLAAARSVEIDDMQSTGAGVHPPRRRVQRIGVVVGAGVKRPLGQTHRLAAQDVDSGKQDHARATGAPWRQHCRNEPSMSRPCAEDFSG